MSRAILLSIQPKWIEAIRRGDKTVELRRKRPRLSVPFKVYIYQTKNKAVSMWTHKGEKEPRYKDLGKVVGEFICDDTALLNMDSVGLTDGRGRYLDEIGWKTALTDEEVKGYCRGKRPWGWHISNLIFYDTPRDFSDFGLDHAPQSFEYVEDIT